MSIRINTDKAKAIHLDRLRELRKPKLAALDLAFMQAVERSDTSAQARIAAEKQALRDVTKATLPDDLDQLKDTIPSILL